MQDCGLDLRSCFLFVEGGILWMRNHPQITITALAGFGTAHGTSLADLGFSAARFAAAAACRGDVGHGVEGKMIVWRRRMSYFGVIELNVTEENGTTSGLQIE